MINTKDTARYKGEEHIYIMAKLEKEVKDSKKKALSARREGDKVTSIFMEGRIAGLISAGRIIKGQL